LGGNDHIVIAVRATEAERVLVHQAKSFGFMMPLYHIWHYAPRRGLPEYG
jgi:hypothetical protein